MKPAPFSYVRPSSVGEAIEALSATDGEGKLLAGGQSLVPLLAMRLARPTTLIDLNHLCTLEGLTAAEGRVTFGSMTRQRDLIAQSEHPLVAEAVRWIGHAAIRSRGTIGGSLAHADPSAELPAVALATNAVLRVQGPNGDRMIAIDDWFETMLQTTIADDEILVEADLAAPTRWGFAEMARREGDFALVLAAVAEVDSHWRVVIGGVGARPWRCEAAEALLDEHTNPEQVGAAISEAVQDTVETFDDLHASASYRSAMAAHVAGQATTHALSLDRALLSDGTVVAP